MLSNHYVSSVVAVLVFCLVVGITYTQVLRATDGDFTYALDDPYIHMSIAKNLCRHGVWGVTADAPSSASSSPLWVLILTSSFLVFGVRDALPLVFNLLGAIGVVLVVHHVTSKALGRPLAALLVTFGQVAAIGLVPMVLSGMEHSLHILLSAVFAIMVVEQCTDKAAARSWRRRMMAIIVIGMLMVATRFEGLFLCAAAGLLLAIGKQWSFSLAVWSTAFVPVLCYSAFSLSQGGLWLPNPVLLKGNASLDVNVLDAIWLFDWVGYRDGLTTYGVLLALMVVAGALLAWQCLCRVGESQSSRAMLMLFLAVLPLHVYLAKVGWLYRYEAYLVCLGQLAIVMALPAALERSHEATKTGVAGRAAVAVLLLQLGILLGLRAVESAWKTPLASKNIYEQQRQMARFLKHHYGTSTVAVNDIGAICYLTEVRVVDLAGLANNDIARQKLAGKFDFGRSCRDHDARIAILYDSWLRSPPLSWRKVGDWTIRENTVCGDARVSFYALTPQAHSELAVNFASFSLTLPPDVSWQIVD